MSEILKVLERYKKNKQYLLNYDHIYKKYNVPKVFYKMERYIFLQTH